jgi:flagellar motor switch/type III secretory pathway protein FliN
MATALAVPKRQEAGISEAAWREAEWLPCRLSAEISVPNFTMGDLMSIEVNSVVATGLATSGDVLVRVNGELVARAELDVVDTRLAVRLTELA